MKNIKQYVLLSAILMLGSCFVACEEANEFEDTKTGNPTWAKDYEKAPHPETLANTKWERGSGLKYNAYGEEVQGFVESMDFFCADSVVITMSQGCTEGSWTDESNSAAIPAYEYVYSEATGKVEVMKQIKDEKGKVSKTVIFTGIAVSGKKEIMTVCHFGDTPVQSYLVKK